VRAFQDVRGVDAGAIVLNYAGRRRNNRTVLPYRSALAGLILEDIAAPKCFDIERPVSSKNSIIPSCTMNQHGNRDRVAAALN